MLTLSTPMNFPMQTWVVNGLLASNKSAGIKFSSNNNCTTCCQSRINRVFSIWIFSSLVCFPKCWCYRLFFPMHSWVVKGLLESNMSAGIQSWVFRMLFQMLMLPVSTPTNAPMQTCVIKGLLGIEQICWHRVMGL